MRSFCQDRLGADIRKRREKEALSAGNETAARPFSWDHQSEFYGDVHCYLYDVDNWYEKHAVSAMPLSDQRIDHLSRQARDKHKES